MLPLILGFLAAFARVGPGRRGRVVGVSDPSKEGGCVMWEGGWTLGKENTLTASPTPGVLAQHGIPQREETHLEEGTVLQD